MSILRPYSKAIGKSLHHIEARLHSSYMVMTDVLEPVIAAGMADPAKAHLDAARSFSVDEAQHLNDASALIAQARDLEGFRVKAAAPEPVDHARDAPWWEEQIRQAGRRVPSPSTARAVQAHGARHAAELLGMRVDALLRSERHWESLLGLPVLLAEGSAGMWRPG